MIEKKNIINKLEKNKKILQIFGIYPLIFLFQRFL